MRGGLERSGRKPRTVDISELREARSRGRMGRGWAVEEYGVLFETYVCS